MTAILTPCPLSSMHCRYFITQQNSSVSCSNNIKSTLCDNERQKKLIRYVVSAKRYSQDDTLIPRQKFFTRFEVVHNNVCDKVYSKTAFIEPLRSVTNEAIVLLKRLYLKRL